MAFAAQGQGRGPRAPGASQLPPAEVAGSRAVPLMWALGFLLSSRARPRRLPVGGGRQRPARSVYLGLFGALPRGISRLMGTALLWDVLGPSYNLALKRSCVLCQEHCNSCSLIWSGNFFAWRKSGGSSRLLIWAGRLLILPGRVVPLVNDSVPLSRVGCLPLFQPPWCSPALSPPSTAGGGRGFVQV